MHIAYASVVIDHIVVADCFQINECLADGGSSEQLAVGRGFRADIGGSIAVDDRQRFLGGDHFIEVDGTDIAGLSVIVDLIPFSVLRRDLVDFVQLREPELCVIGSCTAAYVDGITGHISVTGLFRFGGAGSAQFHIRMEDVADFGGSILDLIPVSADTEAVIRRAFFSLTEFRGTGIRFGTHVDKGIAVNNFYGSDHISSAGAGTADDFSVGSEDIAGL